MATGTHEYNDDERNASIQINVNGELFPRNEAKVSVFDSGFVLGDGVWEGLRLHEGKLVFLEQHLDRLWEGAKALDFEPGISQKELTQRLNDTLAANNMHSDVHIRLMVSRGIKATPYQDPRVTISAPTIVIIAEYKSPKPSTLSKGVELFTVHVRRGGPDIQDPQINSHSKLNCIIACIQATKAGADEALMLDTQGFVATCNSTHFFIIKNGEVWTSSGNYCLHGITRGNVIDLCKSNGITVHEKTFSLTETYSAEEAFVTGTFAGIAPVTQIDGRKIGTGKRGTQTKKLQDLYLQLLDTEAGITRV
ncbi:aminotransferase class IV [Chromatiales bacterium (ex Bugula neritina AB1)]|nr:aminotransferase class IV [Chromatiales bacterium (ex Bugula neritina AB1)]